mmetsp:Transcript_40690/g.39293  ORF Transcript_40690/g.39293 Transcript_40690/m.39293 type:complete len:107 (+) Transcript_40690:1776-2096(+)
MIENRRNEIKTIVEDLQTEFGTTCIVLQEDNPCLEKRLALWSLTNVLFIATLRDGLCVPPLEFVVCKKIINNFKDSLMLLSEFSGCNRAFSGFLSFNPFNQSECMK